MNGAERVLRAADQIQIVRRDVIAFFARFQARHAGERFRLDHERRDDRNERRRGRGQTGLGDHARELLPIREKRECQLVQRVLQEGKIAFQVRKARPCDFGSGFVVDEAESFADRDVIFRLEIERRRFSDRADDDIAGFIRTDRRVFRRYVRQGFQHRFELRFDGRQFGFKNLHPLFQAAHFLDGLGFGGRIRLFGDTLARDVLGRAFFLQLADQATTTFINFQKRINIDR